jgi:hypothetical protein
MIERSEMRICRLFLLAAAAALVVAPVAQAKGPSKAEVNGPGLKKAVIVKGNGEGGPRTPLGDLVEEAGFFPSAYEQTPNPMQSTRPKGDLGPRYTITYTVPSGSGGAFTLRQDVYPYAKPVPVAYMAKGQRVFDMKTRGGWFVSDSSLRGTLVHAGLPARAAVAGSSDSALSFLWDARTLAIVGALVLLGLAIAAVRRRPGPARA